MAFNNILSHKSMLEDETRTGSYEKTIAETVKNGDVVLDLGCGSGILSFFAARAGAKCVYAVDKSRFIRVAKQLGEKNGFDNIHFHYGDAREYSPPEKIDVLITETMGSFVFPEWMFEPVIQVREKYLKPGGKIIPKGLKLLAGFITDREFYEKMEFFKTPRYGIDFSFVDSWPHHCVQARKMKPSQLSNTIVDLGEIDLCNIKSRPLKAAGRTAMEESTTIFGLCGWFDAILSENIGFSTGPWGKSSNWAQLTFPFEHPIKLKKDEVVEVEFMPFPPKDKEIGALWKWTLKTSTQKFEMDDFLYKAWVNSSI